MTDERQSADSVRPSRLWIWFLAAFVAQLVAWVIWFNIAARNPVEEVPLAVPGVSGGAHD